MSSFAQLLEATSSYSTTLHPGIYRWVAVLFSASNLWTMVSSLLLGSSKHSFNLAWDQRAEFFGDSLKSNKKVQQVSPSDPDTSDTDSISIEMVILQLLLIGL